MALVSIPGRSRLTIGLAARSSALAAALCFLGIVGAHAAAAQSTPSATPSASVPGSSASGSSAHGNVQPPAKTAHPVHSSKHAARKHAKPEPPVAAVAPIVQPPPPPPDWPVNDKPVPASVSWNGRNLTIAATNASLQQILTEVSTATGVKVEGAEADQRIFGSFGPAPAREVLSQLLDGSGYNVLIIGDKGEGTPRELVLTARTHTAANNPRGNAQSNQNSDDETPDEPEQPEPTNVIQQHRPFTMQPGQGRSPEQLQEEQRIEQLREQQQQQQQQQLQPQPQPPPPPKD